MMQKHKEYASTYKKRVEEDIPEDAVWAEDASVGLRKVAFLRDDGTDHTLLIIIPVDVILELWQGLLRPEQGQDHEEQIGKEDLQKTFDTLHNTILAYCITCPMLMKRFSRAMFGFVKKLIWLLMSTCSLRWV